MTEVNLLVNGHSVQHDLPPRLHLADFVRDRLLLTGTHLGCEHGVCGACTILVNGEPTRSCITLAALCDKAEIRTIEGLENDPVAIRLRVAFTAHHALQCGYCTPGMMVTAWDIVHRLPDATDDEIRLELAGNLCRCTGYNGIVRAIRQVLDEQLPLAPTQRSPLATTRFGAVAPVMPIAGPGADRQGLHQLLPFAVPPETLWQMLRDPASIASCVPGASLKLVDGDAITGEMLVSLGPVRARFAGEATLSYDDVALSGAIEGSGRDQLSGTRLTASAKFQVEPDGAGSRLRVEIAYTLRGALAQLAKGRIVDLMADEIAGIFATNLSARLAGRAAPKPVPLSAFSLATRMLAAWFRQLLGRHG